MSPLTLHGRAPVPIKHYQKAPGILRPVSESMRGDVTEKHAVIKHARQQASDGPIRLAFLETLLRTADARASR